MTMATTCTVCYLFKSPNCKPSAAHYSVVVLEVHVPFLYALSDSMLSG